MHTIIRYPKFLLAALVSLLGGCAVVPPQPSPRPSPTVIYPVQPAPPNYGQIQRCRSDNQRSHAEVVDIYERARRAGQIDPREAQQFNAMEARLRNLRDQLARDGITLQDCQRIGGAIANERNEVLRMARHDPLARCMADNRQEHRDLLGIYENARRSGRINPYEAQRFDEAEARLAKLRTNLGRDGITLQDCQKIASAIARERAMVKDMIR